MGAREQHAAVGGHRQTGHLVPGDRHGDLEPRARKWGPFCPHPVSTAPAPVPSEHLPAVLLRLEALLFLPRLWRPRGPLSHASPGPPRAPRDPRAPRAPGSPPPAPAVLTQVQRSTWKMEPSLPPQNTWYSARSMVTAMMPTSKSTDSNRSPDEISHSWGCGWAWDSRPPGNRNHSHRPRGPGG